MEQVDAVVIGAGVVGLAIGARLSQHCPNVLVIDQHTHFGEETSSRNSEVIHAGIYYPKDSLKARFCVRGKHLLYEYCQKRQIPYRAIGKFIVATEANELDDLDQTLKKARDNGVMDLQRFSQQQLNVLAPQLNAKEALFSPSTGIVDSHALMQHLLTDLEHRSGLFVGQTRCERVIATGDSFQLQLNCQGESMLLQSRAVVNAGGLGAQSIALHTEGLDKTLIPQLHLCRGHYFSYTGKHPFKQLIYPVPDQTGAGLGIHATLDLNHQLRFGPDTQYIETLDYHLPASRQSELKAKFYHAIQRYWPDIELNRLQPAYSGIRPKLQGPNDGVQDFCIQTDDQHQLPGLINLFGIESPGLTSSLAIAEHIEHILLPKLD